LWLVGCGAGVDTEAQRQATETAARAQRFADLLGSGTQALAAKRFEQAVQDLDAAVRLQDDARARELLQQAQKAWQEVRQAAFNQAMLRGDQARQEQNYPKAIAAFRDALNQFPDDQEAAAALQDAEFHDFREKGRTALSNEQYVDATKALAQAVKRQPEDKDSRDLLKQAQTQRRLQVLAQGKAALTAQHYPEAVQCFTEAKDLLSDAEVTTLLAEARFQAKLQLGRQQVEANQFAAAIPELEEAVWLQPDHAEARELLQKAKDGKQRLDKADYERAVAAGDAAMLRKDYAAALNAYRDALTKQPQDGTAASKLTQAQNAKAKKDSYDRHMSQGKMQLSLKNYRLAQTEFQAALVDLPGDLDAQRYLQQARQGKR
jgi:tetratricopeptide (TPR) repeat protein